MVSAHAVSDPLLPAPAKIQRVRKENPHTFTLAIEPPGSMARFPFEPGQFNMLYVYGTGEVPISVSGDPGRPEVLVHTIRAVGAVTRSMQQLRKGDSLGVRGPFGRPWPLREAEGGDLVIVAGGIGLAPLRPVIHAILNRRQHYGDVALLYGAREPADLLYRRELEAWRGRLDMTVKVSVDHAPPDWRGRVGVVTRLIPRAVFDRHEAVALVCGPEIMMRYAVAELQERGLASDRIYLSMERNMKCGLGLCGRCQLGPYLVCRDGPVFRHDQIGHLLSLREV